MGAGGAACRAFKVFMSEGAGWSKMSQLRLLYPQVLCLAVGKELLPARVVTMEMKERHPPWVSGSRDLGGGFSLPWKSLGPDLLILSGSSVGTQGVHSSYKVLVGQLGTAG